MAVCPNLARKPGEWHVVMAQTSLTVGANKGEKLSLSLESNWCEWRTRWSLTQQVGEIQDLCYHLPHSAYYPVLGEPIVMRTRQGCIQVRLIITIRLNTPKKLWKSGNSFRPKKKKNTFPSAVIIMKTSQRPLLYLYWVSGEKREKRKVEDSWLSRVKTLCWQLVNTIMLQSLEWAFLFV